MNFRATLLYSSMCDMCWCFYETSFVELCGDKLPVTEAVATINHIKRDRPKAEYLQKHWTRTMHNHNMPCDG
ncbi:uncharacterized protein QC763_0079200 [Podospora pseudopauciseta]|uniref:Uncharacterized protein n=1 Tax=Podospora pseudopauciseta TaxID=2093780 RepID=A0ABR0H6W9_9PEZI|nr:hypothetical protein QC763_0079200 [Podospora pseudopauciseta]